MNIMAIMFVFHVDTIPYNNRIGKGTAPAGAGFSCNNVPLQLRSRGR